MHRHHWDVTAVVGWWDVLDAAVVLFRGTNSANLHNWIADLDILTAPYSRLPLPGASMRLPRHCAVTDVCNRGADTYSDNTQAKGSACRRFRAREGARGLHAFARAQRPVGGATGAPAQRCAAAACQDCLRRGSQPRRCHGRDRRPDASRQVAPGRRAAVDIRVPARRECGVSSGRKQSGGALRASKQHSCDRLCCVQDFDGIVAHYVNESVRITHAHDVVPSLPSRHVLGYHHFAREVWQLPAPGDDESGAHMHFRVCDGSGEDPTCHNSACFLGLCHNLNDHMHYLGKHMYHRKSEC